MNETDKRISKLIIPVVVILVIIAVIIAIMTGEPLLSECNVNTPC